MRPRATSRRTWAPGRSSCTRRRSLWARRAIVSDRCWPRAAATRSIATSSPPSARNASWSGASSWTSSATPSARADAQRKIDVKPIDAATRDSAANLGAGALVVYETTLPVGTTRDRFGPMLAEGSGKELDRDFFLAFSPERVLVGRVFLDLQRYPKVVGGTSDESTRRAVDFYR